MKIALRSTIMLSFLLLSENGFSLIQGRLALGTRTLASDDYSPSGNEQSLSIHLDPVPLIPVSFGLNASNIALRKNLAPKVTSEDYTEFGLEVMGWIPLVPIIKPYAKLRYVLLSKLKTKADAGTFSFDSSGTLISIGGEYSIIPFVSAFVEYGLGPLSLKPEKGDTTSVNSKSLLLGLAVGL
jgi:hypothetical protein